jgi:hypothetical protein
MFQKNRFQTEICTFLSFMKTIALVAQFHYTSLLNFYNSFLYFFEFAFITLDLHDGTVYTTTINNLKAMYTFVGVQPKFD